MYKEILDAIGTVDILADESATLDSRDCEFLLKALSSRVNDKHVRIVNKASDIYVLQTDEIGTFETVRYKHEPSHQVADLSRGFNLSKQDDYDKAVEILKQTPRLVVFKAWLSGIADPDQMLLNFDRVVELSKKQNDHNLGFLVVSEPEITRLCQSDEILKEKSLGWRWDSLGLACVTMVSL